MAYYGTGDYYAMGDPGLLSSIGKALGKGIKAVGKGLSIVGKIAPLNPISLTASALGGAIGGVKRKVTGANIATSFANLPQLPGMMPPMSGPITTLAQSPMQAQSGSCTAGYHANKAPKYCNGQKVAEKGTYCVPNRRMNPGNAAALRRAVRREKAFIGLARAALRGTGITIGRRSFAKKGRRR